MVPAPHHMPPFVRVWLAGLLFRFMSKAKIKLNTYQQTKVFDQCWPLVLTGFFFGPILARRPLRQYYHRKPPIPTVFPYVTRHITLLKFILSSVLAE
jgi:hypothetical protein